MPCCATYWSIIKYLPPWKLRCPQTRDHFKGEISIFQASFFRGHDSDPFPSAPLEDRARRSPNHLCQALLRIIKKSPENSHPASLFQKSNVQKKCWRWCFMGCVFFCKLDLLFTEFTVVTTWHIMSWDPSASCFLCPPAINVWDPRSNRMLALVAIGSESLGPVSPVSIYLDGGLLMFFWMVFLMVFWHLFDGFWWFLMVFWWAFDGCLMVCWWFVDGFWWFFEGFLRTKEIYCPWN